MEDIKKLQAEQINAYRAGDFAKLNEINKKIYQIREQKRKAKAKTKEQEQDDKMAELIEQILTK